MLSDVYQYFGNDIQTNSAGDLATVSGKELTKQRILRRLLTPIGSYVFHPSYGAGLPQEVGQLLTPDKIQRIKSIVFSNVSEESTVAKSPAPQVTAQEIFNGLIIQIAYYDVSNNQQDILTFTVTKDGITS